MLLILFLSYSAYAQELQVLPGKGVLQAAINTAKAGDVLKLSPGLYTGSINIDRSLTISGSQSSVIDGEGSSHVITVSAPDVIVRGLTVQHSGNDLNTEDSAIFITDKGDRTLIDNNVFENNLIGIYLKGPDSAVVSNNIITGSTFHRMNDRGNGVYLCVKIYLTEIILKIYVLQYIICIPLIVR